MVANQREAVIVSACRTAMGRFMRSLATLPAPRLGAVAIGEVVVLAVEMEDRDR
jgi:acetyl-CoA acetyltransferase